MGTTTLSEPKTRTNLDARPPHDARTDVKLAGDWLDRWMMELDETELRAYLQLAHFYNTRTYHDANALTRVLGGKAATKVIEKLERRGLVEVIDRAGKFHYHFPHRDADGYHRAQPARPSLQDALAFQERMSEELTELTEQDETPALRDKLFRKYPQLREEYELYQSTADPSAPRWRLWMELSNLLIREFESRYGTLRQDHGALFKEVSAKVLSHHLELIDGVVGQVLEHLDQVFPEVHHDWVVAPAAEDFMALPFVRRQAQRYRVGAEQILVNAIEALGNHGLAVCSLDEDGNLASLLLPSDTGLTLSEERVLFLRPEERQQADTPRNRERVQRARNKYANYLLERGVAALADFVSAGRVKVVDAWLDRVVEMVNEALSLLPTTDDPTPVKLEHVIDRYDAVRQGQRLFVSPPPLPRPGTSPRLPTRRLMVSEVLGEDGDEAPAPKAKKAPAKKAAKKAPAKKAAKTAPAKKAPAKATKKKRR